MHASATDPNNNLSHGMLRQKQKAARSHGETTARVRRANCDVSQHHLSGSADTAPRKQPHDTLFSNGMLLTH
jgi:hypothetical protein